MEVIIDLTEDEIFRILNEKLEKQSDEHKQIKLKKNINENKNKKLDFLSM